MPRPRGLPHTGGREKGTLNRVTVELRDAAQKYTPAALQVLQSIMCNPKNPAAARVQAAAELLNRGHGRPHATSDVTVTETQSFIRAPSKSTDEEWKQLLERRQALAESIAPKPKPKTIEAKTTPKLN